MDLPCPPPKPLPPPKTAGSEGHSGARLAILLNTEKRNAVQDGHGLKMNGRTQWIGVNALHQLGVLCNSGWMSSPSGNGKGSAYSLPQALEEGFAYPRFPLAAE